MGSESQRRTLGKTVEMLAVEELGQGLWVGVCTVSGTSSRGQSHKHVINVQPGSR